MSWKKFLRNPSAVFGAIVLVVFILTAIGAPFMVADPNLQKTSQRLAKPFWMPQKADNQGYVLGSDQLGRDILSRIIYGARISLAVGLGAVLISGTLGVLLGLLAGFWGRWVDSVIMRITDTQLTIPFLILALAVVSMVGPSLRNLVIVLGVSGWPQYARVVRGEVLSVRRREFVEAARALGMSSVRLVFRHILPNVTSSIIVVATFQFAHMIISEASLSYLGLGVPPPTATWGGMVADGRNYVFIAWWVSTLPGIAILFTVLAVNLVGDWLRDTLDPYTNRS